MTKLSEFSEFVQSVTGKSYSPRELRKALKSATVVEKKQGPFTFSSTQFNLEGDAKERVLDIVEKIDDEDLAADGKENEPHITVKYGLHTTDVEQVINAVKDYLRGGRDNKIRVTLGKIDIFSNPDADVVYVEVWSEDLIDLNHYISQLPNSDKHPKYQPHLTLAYVKPGLGAKYKGWAQLEGERIKFKQLQFSTPDGLKYDLPLDLKKIDLAASKEQEGQQQQDQQQQHQQDRQQEQPLSDNTDIPTQESQAHQLVVAVDLDGTICEYDVWHGPDHFGQIRKGARDALQHLKDKGYFIVVWTTRGDVSRVHKYLSDEKVPFDSINFSPYQPKGSSCKVAAHIYIDDRAISGGQEWHQIIKQIEDHQLSGESNRPQHLLKLPNIRQEDTYSCILPNQVIQGRIVGASKAWYSGQAVEIHTASGAVLSVTPNHPVLTKMGFIDAGKVCKGQDLLRYLGRIGHTSSLDNKQYAPMVAEKVFETVVKVSSVVSPTIKVATSALDFHGDSKSFQGKVQVVGSYSKLLSHSYTYRPYAICYDSLIRSRYRQRSLSRNSCIDTNFFTPSTSSSSVVRRVGLSGSGFRAHSTPHYPTCFGPASNLNSIAKEKALESAFPDTTLARELLKRNPRLVQTDEVVHVRHFYYSGWVYDFETEHGFIVSNSIMISNCGAAVAMSVGRYFGVGPETLEEWKKALGTTEKTSTLPSSIVKYLESLGLRVDVFEHMEPDDLRKCWAENRPVITPIQEYGVPSKQASYEYGHYVVVIGADLGMIFVQDPSADNALGRPGGTQGEADDPDSLQARGVSAIPEELFMRRWHDEDYLSKKYNSYGIAVGIKEINNDPSIAHELTSKSVSTKELRKGQGEPCKQGETSASDGCTPASGDKPSTTQDTERTSNTDSRSFKYSISQEHSDHLQSEFGLHNSDLALVTGAQDGSTISLEPYKDSMDSESIVRHKNWSVVHVKISHPDYVAYRDIIKNKDGSYSVYNEYTEVFDKGKGLGTKIFADQVSGAVTKGFKYITNLASRNDKNNGYYTWARLGYDADLDELEDGDWDKRQEASSIVPGVERISDLMKTPQGRKWWLENGVSFSGTFDLSDNSLSRQVLDSYIKETRSLG